MAGRGTRSARAAQRDNEKNWQGDYFMGLFQWIYDSGFGQYMRESLWGYPIALTVHSIGMGLLVGVLVVVDLRILGLFRSRMPFQVVKPIIAVAIFGFIINLISGCFLFVSDAVNYVHNAPFLIKIAGVVAGMVVLGLMVKTPEFKRIQTVQAGAVGGVNLRTLAWASLFIWTTSITAGRLIGYTI